MRTEKEKLQSQFYVDRVIKACTQGNKAKAQIQKQGTCRRSGHNNRVEMQ